jgi:hypothetical protein
MSDYRELVKTEAKKFYDANRAAFEADTEEHGGKSPRPNLSKWIDRTTKLNQVVEGISAKWTHKDFLWVQNNTRNKPKGGGDPKSNAFGSFYLDVLHELKKISKA